METVGFDSLYRVVPGTPQGGTPRGGPARRSAAPAADRLGDAGELDGGRAEPEA